MTQMVELGLNSWFRLQVLAGYETTAFAYGQTGTGKTRGPWSKPEALCPILDVEAKQQGCYQTVSVQLPYLRNLVN